MNESLITLIIATVVAGVVGYYSIAFLLKFLKTKSNLVFIVYRIVVGLIIMILVSRGIVPNLDPEETTDKKAKAVKVVPPVESKF
mgnify:CR=1 FL=1